MDDALLVDRPGLVADLDRAVRMGENVLIVGAAGSGKTTLTNYLVRDLQRRGAPVVLIHAGIATSAVELVGLVNSRLPAKTVRVTDAISKASAAFATGEISLRGPRNPAIELADAIRTLEREQPVTIVLDELSDVEIARALFGRARDALWSVGHQWVLTARPEQEAVLTTPPADAFWAMKVEVPPWTPGEAIALLERRGVVAPPSALPTGLGRTPREILVNATQPPRRGADPGPLGGESAAISPNERRVLDALVALDRPVAATDDELLVRVGWSPAHVQRVLRRLADAGRISATTEPPRGPGRPRLIYRAPTVPALPE